MKDKNISKRQLKKRKEFIIITGDHGGWKEGYCFCCDALGWVDNIKHKKDCPVATEYKYLTIEVSKKRR